MHKFNDNQGRPIRLSEERLDHIESDHPEMVSQFERISETLAEPDRIIRSRTDVAEPDRIIRSRTDASVELFYKHYAFTPVSTKFLCIIVKVITDDNFIITAYYTDSVKGGELLWEKK
ncbi:MAG: hypothetical protein JRF08_08280 [Deltaproteobacteria bacterium]|nr:hypothetical protein [Deltaproteobacteria bacterium]